MVQASPPSLIPVERIASCIYVIRGKKVMIDADLAALYQAQTQHLNHQPQTV